MVLILCITLISALSAVFSFFRKSKKEVKIQKDDWKRDVVYLYQFPRSKAVPCLSTYCMKVKIQKEDWKRDVVYLYQFPRSKAVPCLSTYCMKVETFLRANKIPHEVRVIFLENPLPSPRDEAMARAVGRMCENHTSMLHYKFKVVENPSNNYTNIALEDMGCASWLFPFAAPLFSKFLRSKVSLGDFSVEDCKNLLKKDYDAYRDLLGDRKFLFGDEVTVNYAKDLLKERYPTLVAYTERVKEATFGSEFAQE
ncbi:unnamed protein product [Nippostrongylus brasiliensis]|uniref:Failed axon connections (inferred by orthology to a D. melanogaster protein) n=1 Tax=Nippostrongylus brasiliensis TaxID=27835 RepID=A0A0N4YLS4_NIPBR|nr:unnamed protein product [Nippostrongylus brasiliensis]